MRNLPVACPRCAHQQIIKIRDLDAQQECSECRTAFYIDSAGACIRGRRPASSGSEKTSHLSAARLEAKDPFEILGRTPRWLSVGLFAGLLMLGAWFVARAISMRPEAFPESLPDRATFAAECFARNDLETILKLADSSTSPRVREWFGIKRNPTAVYWGMGPPEVSTNVLFKKESNRVSATVSVLRFNSESTDVADSPDGDAISLRLVLFWTLGENQLWLIDGDKTLREASRVR